MNQHIQLRRTYQMGAQFRLRSLQQQNTSYDSNRTNRSTNQKKRFLSDQMTVLSKIELSYRGKDKVELIYESYPVIQDKITSNNKKKVKLKSINQYHLNSKTISFHQVKRTLQTYINQ